MTEIKLVREDEIANTILGAIIQIDKGAELVPVVRCKECKYCDQENGHCDHPMGTTLPVPRKQNDFCSYGERREGE